MYSAFRQTGIEVQLLAWRVIKGNYTVYRNLSSLVALISTLFDICDIILNPKAKLGIFKNIFPLFGERNLNF